MNEREKILARIREAIRFRAPVPGRDHDGGTRVSGLPNSGDVRQWLPKVGQSQPELLDTFAKTATELKADFRLVQSKEQMLKELVALRDKEGWKKVGSHDGQLNRLAIGALQLPVCHTSQAYETRDLEACDAGISECDALVAQTGSVLVTNQSAGGRALSVLPPHHVVLARADQLLPDLPAAFALLKSKYVDKYPSFISFITGPSRTGDIERILVLGAHGPKKLTIFCLHQPE